MSADSDTSEQQSRGVSPRTGPGRSGSPLQFIEVNFDGLVGPTHNYAGLSPGNLASARHADTVSHPKQAALQGLAKMKLLRDLGVPQAMLPPQRRPAVEVLHRLGFADVQAAGRESPRLLAGVYSSSAMWAANAATVSPAADTADGRIHVSPANLITQFHRSLESVFTAPMLRNRIDGEHHDPLPAADSLADEGAANHLRLCGDYGRPGLEIFVYGRDETSKPARYPARQTRLACEAIARRHRLDPYRTMIVRQSPEAIDAGAFHNDVVVASNRDVLLVHRQAFFYAGVIQEMQTRFEKVIGRSLWVFIAEPDELSLADAVSTYIFNSQIVTLPDGTMSLIAPLECRNHAGVQRYLERILASGCPIKSVHYVDLRQSMHNGGGPACLRLRVVMPKQKAAKLLMTDEIFAQLTEVIERRYRDSLSTADLADPVLVDESHRTIAEIESVCEVAANAVADGVPREAV
jgi:succinylarginine dihydrolase